MSPQPLISVRDVQASSRWYHNMLGLSCGHGGPEYEQLLADGRMVMQLHAWDVHEHPHLGSADGQGRGNGVALWFQTEHFDQALARIRAQTGHANHVLEGPMVNPLARHREIWLRDPDGYVVVVAGAYGDLVPAFPFG